MHSKKLRALPTVAVGLFALTAKTAYGLIEAVSILRKTRPRSWPPSAVPPQQFLWSSRGFALVTGRIEIASLASAHVPPAEAPIVPVNDPRGWRLGVILCVAFLGLWWMINPAAYVLWRLWTTNGLASIGLLIPPAVVILVIHAWRGREWSRGGTWWGFALCVATQLLTWMIKERGSPVLMLNTISISLLPTGLLVFLYVSGVILLFAGKEAYRAVVFPVCLLLFLNPLPKFFTNLVDLPLQYIGAHTARNFAHWIGVPLAVDNLQLMFSPALGMFIAPGCNGLRGVLTMGLLTLILGHLYRMPLGARGVYVAAGVVLAYLLNLIRLCTLVLCYRLSLNFTPLARHMEAADYVLGSLIFFSAAVFLFAIPRKWNTLRKQTANS